MQKCFEKIKERLEDTKGIAFLTLANTGDKTRDIVYDEVMIYLNTAIEIVNQVAEEYNQSLANDGWLPVSSGEPQQREMMYWVTYKWADGSIHVAKDIYTDNGEWFETKSDSVLAWMPINEPAPYQPKDCNSCANHTDFDEVDNGCYMCCKGLENNYQPKGE